MKKPAMPEKNARFEMKQWLRVKPMCHPTSTFVISLSAALGIYSIRCAVCNNEQFAVQVTTKAGDLRSK